MRLAVGAHRSSGSAYASSACGTLISVSLFLCPAPLEREGRDIPTSNAAPPAIGVAPWRRRVHAFARFGRSLLLRLASPIDRFALLMNGKGDYPPIYLRRQNGPLNAFERTAGEYVGLLAALAGLNQSSRIVDVGCGAGALAIMIDDRLGPDGRYLGFDVDRPSVAWCAAHLAGSRFTFVHHDYWNATYNPDGERDKAWPVQDAWADIVVLKSVFTHMLPADIDFYVSEIKRVLAPGGAALVTTFAYNSVDDSVRRRFPLEGQGFRYARAGAPEAAIAYPAGWLLETLANRGLAPEFHPGSWRPQDGRVLAYQDVILARHRGQPEQLAQ